jgi:parallel beta-helix repeat protein
MNPSTYGINCGYADPIIENCIIENNNDDGIYCSDKPTLRNLIIRGNQNWGILIHQYAGPLIDCCTIVGNNGGGIYFNNNDYPVQNTIIWGNAMPQIQIYSTPYPNYCCIQDVSYTNKGVGNIYANPKFVSQQDLYLTEISHVLMQEQICRG